MLVLLNAVWKESYNTIGQSGLPELCSGEFQGFFGFAPNLISRAERSLLCTLLPLLRSEGEIP